MAQSVQESGTTQPREGPSDWRKHVSWYFAAAMVLLSLLERLLKFFAPSLPPEIGPRVYLAFFAIGLLAAGNWYLLRLFHKGLTNLTPWAMAITVVLNSIILFTLYPRVKPVRIAFSKGTGAIFNSWDGHPDRKKAIRAWGDQSNERMWAISQNGEAHFSYEVNSELLKNETGASSGGFMTFYGSPFDRLAHREIRFACMATATKACTKADIGVRLAVDDPHAPANDRERVTYEVSSVADYYNGKRSIDATWKEFSIDLSNFKQKQYIPPLSEGIDENTINKMVFFVSNENTKNCPEATLWFRDVTTIPR